MSLPTWLWASLAGAALAALASLRLWWERRRFRADLATVRAAQARAELERDAAGGRAAVAEAETTVLAEHVERTQAADAVAEEIDHATAAAAPDGHLAERAALYRWMQEHPDGQGDRSGDRPATPVRDQPAADPKRRRPPG